MDAIIVGDISNADGKPLSDAKAQLITMNADLEKLKKDLLYWQNKLQEGTHGRNQCSTKACRRMHDEENAVFVQNINNTNTNIDKQKKDILEQQSKIETLQKQYDSQVAIESQAELTKAQAGRLVNPEIQKSMNELEALMKKKKTLIIIVIVVAVLIAGTVGGYFYLKSKGKI